MYKRKTEKERELGHRVLRARENLPRIAPCPAEARRSCRKPRQGPTNLVEPRRGLTRPAKLQEALSNPDEAPRGPSKLQESLLSPDEAQRSSPDLRQHYPSISNLSRPPTRPRTREKETTRRPSPTSDDLLQVSVIFHELPRGKFCKFNISFFPARLQVLLFFRFTSC